MNKKAFLTRVLVWGIIAAVLLIGALPFISKFFGASGAEVKNYFCEISTESFTLKEDDFIKYTRDESCPCDGMSEPADLLKYNFDHSKEDAMLMLDEKMVSREMWKKCKDIRYYCFLSKPKSETGGNDCFPFNPRKGYAKDVCGAALSDGSWDTQRSVPNDVRVSRELMHKDEGAFVDFCSVPKDTCLEAMGDKCNELFS